MTPCSPMYWQVWKMVEASISALSGLLRLIPDWLPGKSRLGRMLLHPFELRVPATLIDRAGCRYVLPSYAEPIAQDIFTFGAYEAGTRDVILEFLSLSGTFIDVGANVGAITVPIAKARPRASIMCVEADPYIHRMLEDNVRWNGCTQVRTISCIAGIADDQLIAFYRAPKEKFGMGSVGPQFGAAPIMVKQRTLDTLLVEMNIDQVDVVKIDVEGAELGVLRGAQHLLASKKPPVVIFEFADWAEARIPGQQPGDAQGTLFSSGYRLFQLSPSGGIGEELLAPMHHGATMLLGLPPHVSVPWKR